MPVLISQNLVESCIFLNENHAHLRKKKYIRKSISAFYHQIFFLSFDSNLSQCKLQLIDLVMVSVACLVGWQTILECFSRELWVRRKRKEALKWMEN